MKANESVKSSVAEWEQAIIAAAGEERCASSDDKVEEKEENVREETR